MTEDQVNGFLILFFVALIVWALSGPKKSSGGVVIQPGGGKRTKKRGSPEIAVLLYIIMSYGVAKIAADQCILFYQSQDFQITSFFISQAVILIIVFAVVKPRNETGKSWLFVAGFILSFIFSALGFDTCG